MGRVVTGVTLKTFPQAVREAGLTPDQKFTVIVEGAPSERAVSPEERAAAFARLKEIANEVHAKLATDGITTEAEIDAFIRSLDDDR